jgi:hypothetical protein
MDKDLKLLSISYDVRYVFTNKGILETTDIFKKRDTRFIEYTEENIPLALEMVREHYQNFYNAGQISLMEYVNSPRKVLYNIVEILQPQGNTRLIREWEETFGDKLLLINESSDKFILENRINDAWGGINQMIMEWTLNPFNSEFYSGKNWGEIGSGVASGIKQGGQWVVDQGKKAVDWTVDQARQIRDKGFFTWAGEKVTKVFNYVKDAISKAWNCLTANFFECLMEGIRSFTFSAIGMGTMTALSFVQPIGVVADVVVFGALLIWDIYKMMSGKYESGEYKWSWFDIICDAIFAILPLAGRAFKSAGAGVKSMEQLGTKAATEGGIFKKVLEALKGGLSKIGDAIAKGVKWVGEKLGLEFLTKFGSKAESVIAKGVKEASRAEAKAAAGSGKSLLKRGIESVGNLVKGVKLTKPLPVVIKKFGKTVLITGAFCAAIGADGWTCKHRVENGEFTPEEMKKIEQDFVANAKSGNVKKEMDKMSVKDAESIGLF